MEYSIAVASESERRTFSHVTASARPQVWHVQPPRLLHLTLFPSSSPLTAPQPLLPMSRGFPAFAGRRHKCAPPRITAMPRRTCRTHHLASQVAVNIMFRRTHILLCIESFRTPSVRPFIFFRPGLPLPCQPSLLSLSLPCAFAFPWDANTPGTSDLSPNSPAWPGHPRCNPNSSEIDLVLGGCFWVVVGCRLREQNRIHGLSGPGML